jgi:signal transduction histidine kinase
LISAPAYLAVRVFSRLWSWWEQLRRRRFLWALTHAHLLIVVFMGVLFLVISTAWVIFFASQDVTLLASLPPDPVTSILSRVLIWGLILIFLTIALVTAGILVILPPSAVFSYLVARSMTYRWKALADAAEQMRRGDLSARVEVQGEDEVARLQESFNVMAQALQNSSGALQAERDRVRSLLITQRELAANISHELRTPVSTVNGYLDYALGHWDEIEPQQSRRDLQVMSHEMHQLAYLIEDLFTLSRAEVDRLSLDMQPVAVIPLLQQAVAAVQRLAWEVQRVEVIADLPLALPPVQADASRLEQIVRNLLQNGIRHTPPGGFVSVSAALAGDWVCIEVVDSGEGIAAQDLPHIWERFYRSQATRRLEDGGAGIGLALVKELVDAMQGRVEVASQPGEGSTFTVYLRHVCDTDSTEA